MKNQTAIILLVYFISIPLLKAQANDTTAFEYSRVYRNGTIVRAYYEDGSIENLKEKYKFNSAYYNDSDFNSFFFTIVNHMRSKQFDLFIYNNHQTYTEFIFRRKTKIQKQ